MSSNSSQTLGSVDSTLSKESSSSNLSNIINDNMENNPDNNNNPPGHGEDRYDFAPIPPSNRNNPDWDEYEQQQRVQGNTFPFLPPRTGTPYVFEMNNNARNGRNYRTMYTIESQEDYLNRNPHMAYGSGNPLPELGANHTTSSPSNTVTPSEHNKTKSKTKTTKLSVSQNKRVKNDEKVRTKTSVGGNKNWLTQELTDCDGFDPISQHRISKRKKVLKAANQRKNEDNLVDLLDTNDDDEDFVKTNTYKNKQDGKKKKKKKVTVNDKKEIIDVDAASGDQVHPKKMKKNRSSTNTTQGHSKKARSTGNNGNEGVKGKAVLLKEAPPGAICKGCNKEKKFCHENLYGNFTIQTVYDYTTKAGNEASLAGMEQAFIRGFNTIHRAKEFELYENYIPENEVHTPSPCVYQTSYLNVVDFYCEHIKAEAKNRVDEIINHGK